MTVQDRQDALSRWVFSNTGVILTVLVLAAGALTGYTTLQNRVEAIETARAERVLDVNARLDTLEVDADRTPNIEYRLTALEESLRATSQRVDLGFNNISERLAEINRAIGSMTTELAVLTQRLEGSPERRTDLRPAEER